MSIISQLGQYLTDFSLEFLASLEARLGRLGISTLSQLGDVKVAADTDPNAETRALFAELWKKILSFFKSNQVLQRLQFVKVVNAAIAPVAPVVATPELQPPPSAPVRPAPGMTEYWQRISRQRTSLAPAAAPSTPVAAASSSAPSSASSVPVTAPIQAPSAPPAAQPKCCS